MVDYLYESHASEVEKSRLVLYGNSFAGFLSARAAAFEPRISAVALDGGIYSFFDGIKDQLPGALLALYEAGDRTAFDAAVTAALRDTKSTGLRWGIEQGLWSFKTASPYDWLSDVEREYTLEGVVEQIQMPV